MIIFYFGLAVLLYFSYLDIRHQKLQNWLIGTFFLIGLSYHYFIGNALTALIGAISIGILGYALWHFKTIGGADSKLLSALVFYLPFFGYPNMIATLLIFIIWLGLIGSIYGFLYKLMFRAKKVIPFIPAITLTFLCIWLFKII